MSTVEEREQQYLTDDDMRDVLRAAVEAEGSQRAFAEKFDINQSQLSMTLQDRVSVTEKVAQALGYERVTLFQKVKTTKKARA